MFLIELFKSTDSKYGTYRKHEHLHFRFERRNEEYMFTFATKYNISSTQKSAPFLKCKKNIL